MISKLAREFSLHIDRKLQHLETEARRAFTEQYKDTALEQISQGRMILEKQQQDSVADQQACQGFVLRRRVPPQIPAWRREATSVALVVPLAVTQARSRRMPWPPSLRLLTRPRSGIPRPWNRSSSSRPRWSLEPPSRP